MEVTDTQSIIQTMMKTQWKNRTTTLLTNYELFAELAEGVFGRLARFKNPRAN